MMGLGVDSPLALDTIVLATSVSAAILYGVQIRAPPSHSRAIVKTGSTALLSVFAAVRGESWLLVSALALGALGDSFLAWPGDKAFLRGLSTFLVAHILYIILFIRLGGGVEAIIAEGWWKALAAAVLALVPAFNIVLVPRVDPSLRLPIVVYSTTILVMVFAVLTLRQHQPIIGALFFATSDAILTADEYLVPAESRHRVWMQYAVWALYYSGQLLIATGLDKAI